MCPFPIYPLYTRTVILSLDKPIADCFLFRPRKRLEKCRKRSHTNVSNASVIRTSRVSQTPLQTPLPCFHASINEYYTAKNGLGTIAPRLLSQVKVGTHLGSLRKIAHSGLHAETGAVSDGGAITTLGVFRTFTNIPGPGIRTAYFAALGSWPGGALEERRKPSGQRCAYACRCPEGVAAPLGCVIFFTFVEIGICTSGAHGFPRVQGMGGITTPGARCVLPKFSAPACQSGLFAVF